MRFCTVQVLLEGLQVDYYSQHFECWAPAVVKTVNQDTGEVTINCRHLPLSRKEAQAALRPRTRPGSKHLEWITRVLRDGLVESEAQKLFERHATRGCSDGAALAGAALDAAGEDIDRLLGISGAAYELRRRAAKAGRGGARGALPAGWERRRSATTGRDYYCSAGRSQWEHPGGAARLDAEAFVAAFWEMLGAINQRWGQVFMLKEDRLRGAEELDKEYIFDTDEKGERLCLGEGTFGAVYLARHRKTNICRAVKEVKCCKEKDALLDRLDSEIGRLRALDHPHIVRLYDCYRRGDSLFLCMDYCSGGDLDRYTQRLAKAGQSIAEDTLRGVARQLLKAIAHIHVRGLLHLDIKPGNVVVVPETRTQAPRQGAGPDQAAGAAPEAGGQLHVMLIDLGLAQIFRPGAYRKGRSLGTPVTMAPEVWRGVQTPAADVFSAGCTLYFLLTGGTWPFRYPPSQRDKALAFWAERPRRAGYEGGLRCPQARNLCDGMMRHRRLRRPTVTQCLQGDFFLGERGREHRGPKVDERLQRLAKAPGRSLLYMSVALAVASEWPSNRLPSIRKAFEELDVAGTGRLQKAQIAQTLISLGHDKEASYKAADAMDLSRDGMVDWTEFVAACVQLGSDSLEEDLWGVFEEADADGDGLLDREDVAKLLPLEGLRGDVVDDVMRQLAGPGAPAGAAARVDFAGFRRHFASISLDPSRAEG